MAAIRAATGGDQYYLNVFSEANDWLKYMFRDGCPMTRSAPGVHVDSLLDYTDYTLICAQADYPEEQFERTSSEGEYTYRTYAARMEKHNHGAAVEATQRHYLCQSPFSYIP